MPRRPKGDEPMGALMKLRLTSAEKRRLQDEAELAGVTMSEYARRRVFQRPLVASADRVMINELRRLGGLLKHIHTLSGGAYSKETAGALADIRGFIAKLAAHDR